MHARAKGCGRAPIGERRYGNGWVRSGPKGPTSLPTKSDRPTEFAALNYFGWAIMASAFADFDGCQQHMAASILAWLEVRGGAVDVYASPSSADDVTHISTRQYARLVDEWVTGMGLPQEDFGTHSLRRTTASLIYKRTGNLRAVRIMLGHTRIVSTARYLCLDVENALTLAEGAEI
ncbi:hypothetical protein CIW48_20900 [Methylobacterium sp. P1-11]|uniref:tyrosine-type recombinase/integrase n=1 Tax=Methylobacterium sp. P1-11 TaxID=2024616 RepID=UPI0011EED5CC|nr:tyrosine-type recombinase/integrase [Methylobacterium sp. P1-11]KAA0122000.1 hypothetical protein CIW48_20900 [Methylobacterium sp. P1-11]